MNPEIINVSINKEIKQLSYPIFIGNNLLVQSGKLLKKYINNKKIIIIHDNYFDKKNSSNKYFEELIQSISIDTISVNLIGISGGDKTKSMAHLENIIEKILMLQQVYGVTNYKSKTNNNWILYYNIIYKYIMYY